MSVHEGCRHSAICAVVLGMAAAARVSAGDPPSLRLEPVVDGLANPVAFVQDPSNPSIQYVVELRGRIRPVVGGALHGEDFLDLSALVSRSGPQGLLGLAFPPDYAADGRLCVFYTFDDGTNQADPARIVRYRRDPDNHLRALPQSAEILIQLPRHTNNSHTGGNMAFGPDGMLYIGMGDNRPANSPGGTSQDPFGLWGKMLRIDVSPRAGYAIPQDNPFLDGQPIEALPEIWSFGWRNPWRWSFDEARRGGTGALVIADVGWLTIEEINYEPADAGGRNYGWSRWEGTLEHANFPPLAYEPHMIPIHEYDHDVGQSITGGFMYRGRNLGEQYAGRYFFADFIAGRIWSAGLEIDDQGEASVAGVIEHTDDLGGAGVVGSTVSFAADHCGELYLVTFEPGLVRKIVAENARVAEIRSFHIEAGVLLEGGVEWLLCSDDHAVRARSGFGETVADLHKMELILRATTAAVGSPSFLDLTVESRIDHPGGVARLLLRNWSTNRFDQVAQYAIGANDVLFIVEDIDATNYVNSNGAIDFMIRHNVFRPFIAFTFESFVDWVEVLVE